MGHPFREKRADNVMRERVSKIAGASPKPARYARGGSVHSDEAEDRALIRKEVKSSALKDEGGKAKHRADKAARRARGGKVKSKGKSAKTNVNVIVAPSGGAKPPMGAPMAGIAPPAGAAPPMPPKPPMAALPPGAPMAPPPGLGGMPPRAKGGRIHADMERHHKGHKIETGSHARHAKGVMEMHGKRARGGKVEGKESLADKKGVTGIGERTPIQHSGNKSDTQNIGRGPVVTKATGGPIYADGRAGKDMGPNLNAGANSGIGRLKKNKVARSQHWEA